MLSKSFNCILLQKSYEKVIERLGGLFDLPDNIIERSKELFGILYKGDGFHTVAVENKKIIAGETCKLD